MRCKRTVSPSPDYFFESYWKAFRSFRTGYQTYGGYVKGAPKCRVPRHFCGQKYILLMLYDKHRSPSVEDIKKPGRSSRLTMQTEFSESSKQLFLQTSQAFELHLCVCICGPLKHDHRALSYLKMGLRYIPHRTTRLSRP
jgi:hypothetical protein